MYIIVVCTGTEVGSGTTSNVGIKLYGTMCNSKVSLKARLLLKYFFIHRRWHDFLASCPQRSADEKRFAEAQN